MKKTIAVLARAAVGLTAANAGVRFGINTGIPVPAPVVVPSPMPAPIVEVAPDCPVPGYIWVGGRRSEELDYDVIPSETPERKGSARCKTSDV